MQENKFPKIILADDDADDYLILKLALENDPDTLLIRVRNGIELMEYLMSDAVLPDVILLDLNLPIKNGFECLKDLKNDPSFKNIPVIIYSTSLFDSLVETTYQNGANLYMQKPNSVPVLKMLIDKFFQLKPEQYIPQAPKENFILDID